MATRTPKAFISCARHSLSASSANSEEEYGACGAEEKRPATELTLTIHPVRCSLILRSTACMQRNAPKKLVSITARKTSIGVSSTAPMLLMPALFTSTSIRPVSMRIAAKAVWTDWSEFTSSAAKRSCRFSLPATAQFFCPCFWVAHSGVHGMSSAGKRDRASLADTGAASSNNCNGHSLSFPWGCGFNERFPLLKLEAEQVYMHPPLLTAIYQGGLGFRS